MSVSVKKKKRVVIEFTCQTSCDCEQFNTRGKQIKRAYFVAQVKLYRELDGALLGWREMEWVVWRDLVKNWEKSLIQNTKRYEDGGDFILYVRK